MGWYRKAAAVLAMAPLGICAAEASAQSTGDLGWLGAAWCSEAHEDYQPGRRVVEIRQIRAVRPLIDPQSKTAKEVALEMRSAVVSAANGAVDMVGGWIEFRFQVTGDRLADPGVQVALTLSPQRDWLSYQYGDGKSYRYRRCGAADAQLEEGRALPPGVSIALVPSIPSEAARQAPPSATDQPAPATDSVHLNRSHCFTLRRSRNGFLGLENQCSTSVNYTYCVLNPTTRQGRFFVCRTMAGTQLGRGSGSVQAGSTGYLGLPNNERGKVVWFACEAPSLPALTGTSPPLGRCQ